jgi:PAS domain S-box-containing protein
MPNRPIDLESLLDAHLGGLVAFTPEGVLARMNPAAEEILGVRRSEMRSAADLIARLRPEDERGRPVSHAQTLFARARRGEVVTETLLSVRRPDGSRRWILACAAPVRAQGEVAAVVVGFMDVTARRAVRTQTAADGTATTPRRARSAPVHGPVPSAEPRDRDLLRRAAHLERLESGSIAVEQEAVDVRVTVLDLLARMGAAAGRVRVEIVPGTPRVHADGEHLDLMLAHLLDNAVRYTPSAAAIVVACRPEAGRVVLEVRDEGPGIPPSERDRVFERFYRGSSAARHEGLGLGLYVVRRLAEAQGGRVTLASEPGKGSTFAIELPAFPGRPR